jgi:hypothetical protein
MKIHELTQQVDEKARLDRAYRDKAAETVDRYEDQVLKALWNPDSGTYREITFTGRFPHNTRTIEKGCETWEVETVRVWVAFEKRWFRTPKPYLMVSGSRHNADNIIWYAEVLKYLVERDV